MNGNYGNDGLHLLVQGYGLSGAITFYVNGVEVEGATATFEAGGGPTPQNLDLVSDVTAQKVETVATGQTNYVVDASAIANTTITVNTIGEVTITAQKYASNPHPGVALPATMIPRFIDIHVDNYDAVAWPMRVEQTYTDAEVAGLDESSLVMYYFKAAAWHECSDTGVNTATNTIWANMTRSELSGSPVAFGEAVAPAPAPAPPPVEGGGGAAPVGPTTITVGILGIFGTGVEFTIDSEGVIQETVEVTSEDGMLTMTIPEGTIALDKYGNPLASLETAVDERPPSPPEDTNIIGLAYDFGPDGATFDPAITLEYTYDPADIPEGVAEEDLVLAYYDEAAGEWVELPSTVDPVTHTITASASHFTTFAIIGAITPPAPAAFSVSNLTIQPAEVEPNEAVTIIVSVANTGGTEGSYTVVLKINGVKEEEKSITVAAGSSEDVSFSVTRDEADSYNVVADGLSGSFTVAAPTPINWSVLGGIIGGVVVVGLLIFFLVRRRAY